MDSLVHKPSRWAVHNALETLPTEVNNTYDEVIARIRAQSSDDRELAENVLSWIAYARRPISLQELQHAHCGKSSDFKSVQNALALDSSTLWH